MTYVQQIKEDTELSVDELKVLAEDRKSWRILAGRGIPPRPKQSKLVEGTINSETKYIDSSHLTIDFQLMFGAEILGNGFASPKEGNLTKS